MLIFNFADELRSPTSTILERHSHANMMLFSDFNFSDINWSPFPSSTEFRRFLDICLVFNLDQVIEQPTHLNNIFDLSLTKNPEVIKPIFFIDGFIVTS